MLVVKVVLKWAGLYPISPFFPFDTEPFTAPGAVVIAQTESNSAALLALEVGVMSFVKSEAY